MKELKKQIKLLIVSKLCLLALNICPKDCYKTLQWFAEIPLEK